MYNYTSYKWHTRFLDLAKEVSKWSKDPSTKVGAIIVDNLGQVVGTGYNGFPRGVVDSEDRYLDRELKYKLIAHAELNAVIQAGKDAIGSTIYVYPAFGFPPLCTDCAKVVVQAGIKRVVGYTVSEEDKERASRWEESIKIAKLIIAEAGVEIIEVKPNG